MSPTPTTLRVALTFDAEHPDRPTRPGVDDELLDTLAERGIRATFFVQGRWAEAYPRTAKRIHAEGHLVGNHSHYHARMPLLTDDGITTDVHAAERTIREVVGCSPAPWFRLPFGTGAKDARVLGVLARAGYRDINWDVDGMDWSPTLTVEAMVGAVSGQTLDRGDGAIVLMHTWPAVTAGALPGIIDRLAASGARFVGVDELDEPSRA